MRIESAVCERWAVHQVISSLAHAHFAVGKRLTPGRLVLADAFSFLAHESPRVEGQVKIRGPCHACVALAQHTDSTTAGFPAEPFS